MARQLSAKTQLFREAGDSTSFRVFSKQVRKMAVKYYLDKAESKGNQWPLEVIPILVDMCPSPDFSYFFYNSKIQTTYYTSHVLSWTLSQITLTSTQPDRMLSSNSIESIVQANPWYNDCILFWEGKKCWSTDCYPHFYFI